MSRTNRLLMNRLRDLREDHDLTQKYTITYLCMSQTGLLLMKQEKMIYPLGYF